MVEKIVGKGEIAGNQHFILSPQCFQKPSSLESLELSIVSICVVKKELLMKG